MLSILLLITCLQAQDIPDEIFLVPAGSTLTVSTTKWVVPRKSYLLPEGYYNQALIKAKQLEICQPALDSCATATLNWQTKALEAFDVAETQMDTDEKLIADLTKQVQTLEVRAITAESLLSEARKSKWVAWAVTGGLVLGASTVIVVTLAP